MEETALAAPKGQANLENSQAKKPQPDRTLERTPTRTGGVTDGEPIRQISQVNKTETGKNCFPCPFLFLIRGGIDMSEPRKTALCEAHEALGARMVDFNGWWLPVQYAGILEEHRAVREQAGLFDVSHMGEIRVKGQDAEAYMQKLVTNDIATLQQGKARYSPMCYQNGGTVDDILIYRLSSNEFWLVVNAANKDKDFAWMNQNAAGFAVELVDESDETAEIALQGPLAAKILAKVSADDISGLANYAFLTHWNIAGASVLLSRTGYTGEDGFEIYCHPTEVTRIWNALLEVGKEFGLQPAGLGCRDTLRFEAAMPLYGHELSAEITPLEAGLSKFIAFDKADFIGKQALLEQRETGQSRKLIGFAMTERGVARAGYPVLCEGKIVGVVTSGSVAPTLGSNLGMALVDCNLGPVGTEIAIEIREKPVAAKIVSRPFYRRRI